jgi:hypothetical protein
LAQGSFSGITVATNLVLRTATDWEALWGSHQSGGDPKISPPAVDFAKEMVVAVTMGLQPTGGYSIYIHRAESCASGLKIFVVQQLPAPDDNVTQALSAPFHFVAVPENPLRTDFLTEWESPPK